MLQTGQQSHEPPALGRTGQPGGKKGRGFHGIISHGDQGVVIENRTENGWTQAYTAVARVSDCGLGNRPRVKPQTLAGDI